MFVTLWEYEVKPGCEKQFEKVYGPDGDWAKLFRGDASYQETRLLRDAARPAIYLTLDGWSSRKAYERFLEAHAEKYKALDAEGKQLTVGERLIGWYERMAK